MKIIFLMLISIIYILKTKFALGLGVFLVYTLIFILALIKNNSFNSLIKISEEYGKKSKIVIFVFIFVGALTSSWLASGTIPGIIYYGIKFINPNFFILFSFLITSLVSFFLGSSFGTASTIGVALMGIARSGGVNLNIVGASIICGIYFGDRWSPLSSSANLVASLTGVDIYSNLKNMVKSMIVPYLLTSIFYCVLSKNYILNIGDNKISNLILENYNLNIYLIFIPLISIIIFSLLRINVKISMGVSITLASIIGVFVQGEKFFKVLNYIIFGFYKFEGSYFGEIIKGGGVKSMLNATVLIFISCSLVGLLEKIEVLNYIKNKISNIKTRGELFKNTVFISLISGMIGANQTITVIMTEQIMEDIYDEKKIERVEFAKDIENSAIILPSIIPWNIACYLPCAMLGIGNIRFIPYAIYIWIFPICMYIYYSFIKKERDLI
ncbi:Na+/H+ antiporter NhaC family protein [Fusobacterium sp.]|uniref:Na+/H+ antiporter NhaC family protein n=1 Tax=Fusobacterium sp. TaxID=68766 RepID=UPI00262B953E|nr:Na+/H+ antiporter NhaC family protein [Fusobacterium sp.]